MTLGIYCAGGLGREVLELARQIGNFDEIVFIDDSTTSTSINHVAVFRFDSFCAKYSNETARIVFATGEIAVLRTLYKKVKDFGYSLQTLVHPSVHIPESCVLGQGVVVQDNVFLAPNSILADGVYLNFNCAFGHDVQIGAFSNISIGCMLAGNVHIGSFSYVGASSCIREGRSVGDHCIIGMGSVVLNNVPDDSMVYGNPAKVVKNIGVNSNIFHH